MKVVFLSDTHDNQTSVRLIVEKESDADLVIHGGDIISPFTLKILAPFGEKFVGVTGNNDGELPMLFDVASRNSMNLFRDQISFQIDVGNKKVLFSDLTPKAVNGEELNFSEDMVKVFLSHKPLLYGESSVYDLVLFGHTHRIYQKFHGKTLYLNPGEACGYLTGKRTYAVIKLPEDVKPGTGDFIRAVEVEIKEV